ncbi:MAG: T9SS type B sorting domain-containing protein [Chitinophagaceae bacterium]|nr:MAG: T9SS type B sorting domain-containing protein [Chitinophagaceae bacterium]
MKKILGTLLFGVFFILPSQASHITGGEMFYTFVSQSGNNYTYSVTLKLFKDPTSGAGLAGSEVIGVFDRLTNALITSVTAPMVSISTITLTTPSPCIINPPSVSYQVGIYTINITLAGSLNGYILSYQRCCRVSTLANVSGSGSVGATYMAEIPGMSMMSSGPTNTSAKFIGVDTVVTCSGYQFSYSFAALDEDNDSLVYGFCDAFIGASSTSVAPNPPSPPPYIPVPYISPFTGISPLGPDVSINPQTGLITGIAPAVGKYVVTVCVREYRNGELIATQRKDLQIQIADCDIASVTLQPGGYTNCNDYSVTFENLTPSSFINSYYWDFGDLTTLGDTSNLLMPTYIYPDTGVYVIKVVANRNQPCSDSTTAEVRVFPGFFPNFNFTGSSCVNSVVQFNDLTTATYGTVNSWRWNFGVPSLANDTSILQNPQYSYTQTGNYTIEFIVGSSKSCIDTIYNTIEIIDKPAIALSFKDSLICSIDTVQLQASGTGAFLWRPNYNIIGATSAAPFVFPKITTWYKVELNNNGCKNEDSVQVRVVDSVTLIVGNDTTICVNDQAQLNASTNGLQYLWSPPATLSNPTSLTPIASPAATTVYSINSIIGGCSKTKSVRVLVVPRPTLNAGTDTSICFGASAQLNGQHNGTSFTWAPASSLNNSSILNPIATPTITTQYVLTVIDNISGCPKPSTDNVTVNVAPAVIANAGRDTTIMAGMPLQLAASGGTTYLWTPSTGLNNPAIYNPIALLDGNPTLVTYQVQVSDLAGCSNMASINVTVLKIPPTIYVPNGFTPNSNGKNDVFRPIYIGIKSVDFFSVYNRWGKLIYTNNKMDGSGWDGTINDIKQNAGTFVWMVKATDITGKEHFKKGTVFLMR